MEYIKPTMKNIYFHKRERVASTFLKWKFDECSEILISILAICNSQELHKCLIMMYQICLHSRHLQAPSDAFFRLYYKIPSSFFSANFVEGEK